MATSYTVSKRSKLLPFLFDTLEGWSKKTIKQRLQGASVIVNGKIQTRHDFILEPNDIIQVGSVKKLTHTTNTAYQTLEILYQDNDLIAINKPAGLLSVGNNKENKQHALALLRSQLSRGKKNVRLWPVHRLDRDTSGVLLFATSKEMREAVMDKWNGAEKIYLAVIKGNPKTDTATINEPLKMDDKEYRMHVGAHKDAKPAITHYKVLEKNSKRSLLEVRIETGRQHQIRAHMAWVGHPVIGDERYGVKGKRMGLHAKKLCFLHPLSSKKICVEINPPEEFSALFRNSS
jgi:23S rRNA pseudouridine1911/1915/1917 synthase